jgi:hypothetical protein
VVKELEELNITSLYHTYGNEIPEPEINPAFFLHKNLDKPYHIDYIFDREMVKNKLHKIQIG